MDVPELHLSVTNPPGYRPRLLVVEDDEPIRVMLVQTLSEAGYRTIACANGLEGLAAAARMRPDLIVLDLVLPVLHGFDFTRRYRRTPPPHAPIVVITAAQPAAAAVARSLGAAAILRKPFEIEHLMEVIAAQLRRRAADQASSGAGGESSRGAESVATAAAAGPGQPATAEPAAGGEAVGAYTYTNARGMPFFLHAKDVVFPNGRTHRQYSFAAHPKPGQTLDALPAGHRVVEDPRTGRPYLRRDTPAD